MQFLQKLRRLFYTVKPLRFEQIAYRIYYKLRPLRHIQPVIVAPETANWIWSAPEVIQPSLLGGNKVCFLNKAAEIEFQEDWNNTKFEKLWLYNLHYFDDLNAKYSSQRTSLQLAFVERWISHNPAPKGNGWEPYPLSLRLVNLIKWYNRANINSPKLITSIAEQADALSKQLEYHILGNHLFANAKALIFAGCFLNGVNSERHLRLGLKILEREIPEQFLPDGGHFELSPMYHCILLWDLLDLINLAEISQSVLVKDFTLTWRGYANKALTWLNVMLHPDNEVAFFNDSTMGIAAPPSDIFTYAEQLNLKSDWPELSELTILESSGYSKITMADYIMLFDHGAVGPDYLPGHAHADTLSLEISVDDERVFVNSGTSIYGVSEERLRQRQTAAHNTVVVNNADSSEVWSGFRVARRAYPTLIKAEAKCRKVILEASHNGYERLKGNVVHQRKVEASCSSIEIYDSLLGEYIEATIHWHLHPSIKLEQVSFETIKLTLRSGRRILFTCSEPMSVLPSTWHPSFGETIISNKIIANFSSNKMQTCIKIN